MYSARNLSPLAIFLIDQTAQTIEVVRTVKFIKELIVNIDAITAAIHSF